MHRHEQGDGVPGVDRCVYGHLRGHFVAVDVMNGLRSIADAVHLFTHRYLDQTPFSDNDNGRIDFADVVWLFTHL
jgi:hypothetical protein